MRLEYGEQRVTVAAGELVIGSDPGAALRLLDASVLPRHAVVRSGAGPHVVLQAASGAEVRVNGARIGSDPTPLMHGDRIGIGSEEILVTDPSRAGATAVVSLGEMLAGAPREASAADLPLPLAEPAGRLISLTDGREYQMDVAPFVLGRDAAAQIVIASPDASRKHAEIVSRPDGEVLVDLSTNGTFVNGSRISGRHRLKPLDVIRIGAEEFRYYPAPKPEPVVAPLSVTPAPLPLASSLPSSLAPPPGAEYRLGDTLIGIPTRDPIVRRPPVPAPPSVPRPLATLLVKSGSLKGQRFSVTSAVVNLGRGEHNDIRIPDPSVSSSHAKLTLSEGVWSLTDMGSTNGTSVDEMPVSDEAPLSPGTTIKLGEVVLSFEPHDEGAPRSERTAVLPRLSEVVFPPAESAIREVPPPAEEKRAPPRRPAPAPPEPKNPVVLIAAIILLLGALAALILFL